MSLTLQTAPATEPITLDEAKLHCKVEHDDENPLLERLVTAARRDVENFLWRAIVTQTWDLRLDGFRDVIALERPPIQSVTNVEYVDANGATQVLASTVYDVDIYSTPGKVCRKSGQIWPVVDDVPNAVKVRFVAGQVDGSTIEAEVLQAILVRVSDYYQHRGSHIVGTIVASVPGNTWRNLLWPLRWRV